MGNIQSQNCSYDEDKVKENGLVPLRQNCALKKFGRRWLGPCTKVKSLKLFDLLLDGGRRHRSVRGMKLDPLNVTCWKHKWCFHDRGVTWDTPMARWAGSGEDWIHKWRTSPPKKAEVIPTLVLAIHLSTLQVKKADGGIPRRKERDLDPLMIKPPRTVEGLELVIRGDSKTVVDWINGEAKQKVSYRAIETIQIQLMEWWKKGIDLSQRIGDWAVLIFWEHNKEADLWAGCGAKGISKEWKDESASDWTKVLVICGFWHGSCNE